jgi:conjugative relaxase-like TrwC/TraI family protein
VLSIGKIGRGRESYYLGADRTTGRAAQWSKDEALESSETTGQWLGRSAGLLGLAGSVHGPQLTMLLEGIDPTTGRELSRSHARVRVRAYDCTFAAPKSVSLLHALAEGAVPAEVQRCQQQAAAAAIGYLEGVAVVRRYDRSAKRRTSEPALGLLGCSFVHRTSRALDPHLHSHVLVANLAQDSSGRWSALDARSLYLHARVAGLLYGAELRALLTVALDVRWRAASEGGIVDLAVFDRATLEAFSTRRAAILAELAEGGFRSRRAEGVAQRRTRTPKDPSVSYGDLVAQWRERSYALGCSPSLVARAAHVAHRDQDAELKRPLDPAFPTGWAGRALVRSRSFARSGTITRRELLALACGARPSGARIDEITAAVDAVLGDPGQLAEMPAPAAPRWYRHGRRIPTGVAETSYSTEAVVALEQGLREDLSSSRRLELERSVGGGSARGPDVATLQAATPSRVSLVLTEPTTELSGAEDVLARLARGADEHAAARWPLVAVAVGSQDRAAELSALSGVVVRAIDGAADPREGLTVRRSAGSAPRLSGALVCIDAHRLGPPALSGWVAAASALDVQLIVVAPASALGGQQGSSLARVATAIEVLSLPQSSDRAALLPEVLYRRAAELATSFSVAGVPAIIAATSASVRRRAEDVLVRRRAESGGLGELPAVVAPSLIARLIEQRPDTTVIALGAANLVPTRVRAAAMPGQIRLVGARDRQHSDRRETRVFDGLVDAADRRLGFRRLDEAPEQELGRLVDRIVGSSRHRSIGRELGR